MTSKVTVYSRHGCQPCIATKQRLVSLDVHFVNVSLDHDDDGTTTATLRMLGHQRLPVVIVVHDDGSTEAWSGHRPDMLVRLAATPLF